ncbi:MAG: pilus retraction protein PilT [Chthonomonadales bacterium]|nr:pilus retraction protein PilT [Chthonomonadales bacterium]
MKYDLDEMILAAFELKASDLFLKSDSIPSIRQHGKILTLDHPPITFEEVHDLVYSKMSPRQQAVFEQHHEMDLAFAVGEGLRIRMNIYQQRGGPATVCRLIPTKIRSLEELGCPPKVKEFTTHRNGLVLVTGPTGSGKTTTLAAMIDLLNQNRKVNIITLEDPIEFAHKDKQAIVSQREIGIDTDNFNVALRHVLRQAPDIILIGEMRDLETMNIALQAAETGHLVFATVHTASAAETLDRVSNMYAPHERPMLWLRLSTTLRGVISQKLLPKADGTGRIAAIEVMDVTPTIINLLEKGQSDEIYSAIRQAGIEAYWGMQTMNQALLQFVKTGQITEADALANANPYTELRQMIRMAVTRGEIRQAPPGGAPPPVPGMPAVPPVPGAPVR